MAFFLTEDEKKDQPASFSLSSGGSTPRQGATQPGGQPRAEGRKPSGGFVGLQSYLGANQGAGQQLAEGIRGGFKEDYAGEASSLRDSTSEQIGGLRGGQRAASGYFSDPADIKSKDFSSMYDQSQNVGDYSAAPSGVDWGNRADLAGSQAGRQTLLSDEYGRNDYSSGMQGLDAAFLGGQASNIAGQASKYGRDFSRLLGTEGERYSTALDQKNEEISSAQQDFRSRFDLNKAQAGEDVSNIYKSGEYGKEFIQRGQDADARAQALNALVGESSKGMDWGGVSGTRADAQAAADKIAADEAAALKAQEAADKIALENKLARREANKGNTEQFKRGQEFLGKVVGGVLNPWEATKVNASVAADQVLGGIDNVGRAVSDTPKTIKKAAKTVKKTAKAGKSFWDSGIAKKGRKGLSDLLSF